MDGWSDGLHKIRKKMNNNSDNRFILDPRHGSSCKTTCPHCGGKKCFKQYIDTETGEPLGEECGRCDHEQSCGYHYTPRDFFQDHPEVKEKLFRKESISSPQPYSSRSMNERTAPKLVIPPKIVYFDMSMVAARHYYDQSFLPWLISKVQDEAKVNLAFEDYRIGATQVGKFQQQGVIFWYIDHEGRVCDGKMMWYGSDGHRTGGVNWVSSQMRKAKRIDENTTSKKCFYGEHLLPQYPDKPVGIVESEKSAIFCSCFYPQYVWLATGGCGGLNAEKVEVLKGRRIVIFPDSGKLEDWRLRLKDVTGLDYSFVDALEQYPPNTDLVDVKLGEVQPLANPEATSATVPETRPDDDVIIANPHCQNQAAEKYNEMCQDYPAVKELGDLFGLEPLDTCPF